jgi:hypothetical protein
MMTVANMLASALREANRKIARKRAKKGEKKERGYKYIANVNHAVGVLKDHIIGMLVAKDGRTRRRLYRELVSDIKRRIVPVRPNREVARKEYLKKPHFHHNHKSNC